MRIVLRKLHRWASLTLAAFWLAQALTGAFLVFHWEIDDATIDAPHRALDLAQLQRGLDGILVAAPGRVATSIWSTAGAPDRFDITLADPVSGAEEMVRVDGHGVVLRRRADGERWAKGGLVEAIVVFHQKLLLGSAGSWIVGVSGIVLLSNIVLGLTLAWPRPGQWRRVLLPAPARAFAARLYGWHRAAGLWMGPIALLTVTCGVLLVFEDGVGQRLGVSDERPARLESTGMADRGVTPTAAIRTAFDRFPGASFAGMSLPDAESPWYRIRVRQPGELRRVFGTTAVYVGARSGEVLDARDALTAPHADRFMAILFPIHTGEAAGIAGRIVIALIGTWLATMIALGLSLWWTRRRAGQRSG